MNTPGNEPPAASWEFQAAEAGQRLVVVVRGELDFAAEEPFVRDVDAALGDGVDVALLDLSAVEFFDSSGLRAVLRLRAAHPDRVRIVQASGAVRHVLEVTGLDSLLDG